MNNLWCTISNIAALRLAGCQALAKSVESIVFCPDVEHKSLLLRRTSMRLMRHGYYFNHNRSALIPDGPTPHACAALKRLRNMMVSLLAELYSVLTIALLHWDHTTAIFALSNKSSRCCLNRLASSRSQLRIVDASGCDGLPMKRYEDCIRTR